MLWIEFVITVTKQLIRAISSSCQVKQIKNVTTLICYKFCLCQQRMQSKNTRCCARTPLWANSQGKWLTTHPPLLDWRIGFLWSPVRRPTTPRIPFSFKVWQELQISSKEVSTQKVKKIFFASFNLCLNGNFSRSSDGSCCQRRGIGSRRSLCCCEMEEFE